MNPSSFSSATLATITNCRNAANQATRAYQLGGQRLIAALNSTIDSQVYRRTAKFAPKLTDGVSQVRGRLTDIIVKGIDGISSRAIQAVTFSSDTAAKQLSKAADRLAGVDNATAVKGLNAVARLSLPGAKLALAVSDMVAASAETLADVASGKAASAVAAAPVARRAKPQRAQVARAVKAVRPVATTLRKAGNPAATAVKKATAPAVAVVKKAAVRAKRKTASIAAPVVQA